MAHRRERLAESIREELSDLIGGELADPRIGLATVTEVQTEPGLRVAHVYVAVQGTAAEQKGALSALMGARGYLRSELASRLQIRQVPELRFELDRSEELTARLDALLGRAHRRAARSSRRSSDIPLPPGESHE